MRDSIMRRCFQFQRWRGSQGLAPPDHKGIERDPSRILDEHGVR